MKILIVRTHGEDDACVRLQSSAIERGLRNNPDAKCITHTPTKLEWRDFQYDIVCFHYSDIGATKFIRAHEQWSKNTIFVCLGSDIYNLDRYIDLFDIADLFVVPTKLHKKILNSQLTTPVYWLAEPVDPVAIAEDFSWKFPIRKTRNLAWFGYAESYYKSMLSLQPIIDKHIKDRDIDKYSLITDITRFPNDFKLNIAPFIPKSFISDLNKFDYVLLSHLPLDLNINTLIKSPNKAITSLVAGVIPIVSNTPAYEELMTNLGLERFLFDSPRELGRLLNKLDPIADSNFIRNSCALDIIRDTLSDITIANSFLKIVDDYRVEVDDVEDTVYAPQQSYAQFSLERLKVKNRLKRILDRF